MAGNNPDTASMEQVRELLMGTQLKDIENRFLRQEERFMRELANLQENMKKRVDSLENFMKSETSSLLRRLKEEQNERSTAIKNEQKERIESVKIAHYEHSETMKKEKAEREAAVAQLTKDVINREEGLERKLAALSSVLDTAEQELRQLLLSENARLSEKIEEKHRDLLSTLTTTAAQLRQDLVSRSALSELFTGAAIKFSAEQRLPSSLQKETSEPVDFDREQNKSREKGHS